MADENTTSTPAPAAAAAAAPSPAPAIETTPAATASPVAGEVAPAVAPASAGAESPAPQQTAQTAEKPAEQPKTEAKKETSLLGEEPKKEEVKPAEGEKKVEEGEKKPEDKKDTKPEEKAGEEKKADGSQSEEPAPLPTYEEFKIPEGVILDKEPLEKFTKRLGEFQNLTKAETAKVQEFGQQLIDDHIAGVQDAVKRYNETLVKQWDKQRNDWKTKFEADPEIGGNRKDTTLKAALEFIRTHGGNEEQQVSLRKLFDETGVGNHPALIRVFANAMAANREGRALPASKPAPDSRSKVSTRYGNSGS